MINVMIWNAAKGGMRSVVEAYVRDGLIESESIRLIAAYCDGSFVKRQVLLVGSLISFARLLTLHRVGFVHIHAAMRGSFWRKALFAAIARRFRVPVVLHLHGSEMKLFYASQRAVVQRMIRAQLEAADRVLVLSSSWRNFIADIAPQANVTVVSNYVHIPAYFNSTLRPANKLLFLGLVGDRKGVFDLLQAFVEVVREHPEARLVIGGNGEIERAMVTASRLGLKNHVELAGWVDGAKKEQLIAEAGIYILPSHNEGLPMSVLEAMAAGLAVITTKVGGIPELITDRSHGMLIDAGDKLALANAIAELIRNDTLRISLMEGARKRVIQAYSQNATLPILRSIYKQVARKEFSAPSLP